MYFGTGSMLLYKLNLQQGTWRWEYPYVKCDRIITSVLKSGALLLHGAVQVSLNPVSLGQMKGQVSMNKWGNICVAVLCRNRLVQLKCSTAELPFLVSFSSGVSAPCSRVLFHCEVTCLSLAV